VSQKHPQHFRLQLEQSTNCWGPQIQRDEIFLYIFLFILTRISLAVLVPGSAEADAG